MTTTITTAAERVLARGPGEGEAHWWFGALAEIKATTEETEGRLTLVELEYPARAAVPLHVHHGEDEGFYVLEGSATFSVGDETVEAGAGTFLLGPRDLPHAFTVGDEGVRMLYLFLPGGFESFIRATGVPAEARTVPPEGLAPDMDVVARELPKVRAEMLAA